MELAQANIFLSQYSKYRDLRHFKALAWMINALIYSVKINLSEWESYVPSRATKVQSNDGFIIFDVLLNQEIVRSLLLVITIDQRGSARKPF